MPLADIQALEQLDEANCRAFTARLASAGYDSAFLGETEAIVPQQVDAMRRPLVDWHLARRGDAAADLAALFSYHGEVAADRVERALGETLLTRLRAAGLIVPGSNGALRSPFLLLPYEGLWFLSDRLEGGGDVVMGPGMTTLLLHRLLPELAGGSVLDLGCGAASLAVDAARRGARAVATDLSPRALAVARFNARLNGVAIETREGDGLAPVENERFDLVLSQPPYVPEATTGGRTTYLHGGRFGDEMALRFVAGCARVLAPGGVALLHFDSAVRADEPLAERLRAAIGDAPAELLALVSRGHTPDQHAVLYAAAEQGGLGESFARQAVATRDQLETLGVREFSRVLVVLRRPRAGAVPGGRYRIVIPAPPVGQLRPGAVRDALVALDVASGPDDALLASHVAPPEDASFRGEWRSPSDESPTRLRVSFGAGSLAQDRELGERGWLLFGLLDGSRTVGEAVAPYAEAGAAEPAGARAEVLGFVREALARGLLRVVAGPGGG